jgi:hypothetical protein
MNSYKPGQPLANPRWTTNSAQTLEQLLDRAARERDRTKFLARS